MTRRKRLPNPHSPEEVRVAFAKLNEDVDDAGDALAAFIILAAATYVPYTGAHSAVNIGVQNFTTTGDVFANEGTFTDDVNAVNGVFSVDVSCVNLTMTGYIDGYAGVAADGEILYWDTGNSRFSVGEFSDVKGTTKAFHNGTFRETFNALLSSDGANITLSLEQSGGGDLTMQFSDGETILDCTPAQTVAITPGTDTVPIGYMVYIPQSTKVLTVGTSWPATEHIRVCYLLVPSATFVFDHNGGYINQNWNDHLSDTANQGHLAHMCAKIRQQGADWYSGVAPSGATASYFTIGAGSVTWQSTAGVVYQMHSHAFLAKDTTGTDLIVIPNDSVTPYKHIQNLFDITADSTGTPITANRYFNLVFWGVANKTGEVDLLMCNLPGGFYVLQAEAIIDSSNYDSYAFPREYDIESSNAFLIARATFQMGATWTHIQTEDLRGKAPGKSAGPSTNDHGTLGGLADDDHTQYSLADGTRDFTGVVVGVTPVLDTHLATKGYTDGYADGVITTHESTYNHANYDTAYGWGNHAGLYDPAGTGASEAASAVSTHESTYDHTLIASGGQIITATNANVSAIVIGEPVYISAASTVDKAQANAVATSHVIGLVKDASIASSASGEIQLGGIFTATTGQWDAITGGTGGLTAGSTYYLSSVTAGRLTATAPTAGDSVVKPVGVALSTTTMKLIDRIGVLL